jgi:hypothetical protein
MPGFADGSSMKSMTEITAVERCECLEIPQICTAGNCGTVDLNLQAIVGYS